MGAIIYTHFNTYMYACVYVWYVYIQIYILEVNVHIYLHRTVGICLDFMGSRSLVQRCVGLAAR